MKRFTTPILAVIVAGSLGLAHAQQPAAGQQGQAAAPAQNFGRPQPKVTSQAEYEEFQKASTKTTPEELELHAMEFEMKFPESEVRSLLFLNTMRAYQNQNNSQKMLEMGRKVLAIYPEEPDALLAIANELASRTRETDLDREERLTDAMNTAQQALAAIDEHTLLPPNSTPQQADDIKNMMKGMAHTAMGTVELARKNYTEAEGHYETATKINTAYPDPVVWLRLTLSREQQKKYPEALDAANQAVKLAPEGSQVATLARSQRDRLQKLAEGGGAGAGAEGSSPAPTPQPAPAPSTPAPQ